MDRNASLFRMVATMRFEAFHTFREFTDGASAIQCEQYKRFEGLCGLPPAARLASPAFESVPAVHAEVSEGQDTMTDAYRDALATGRHPAELATVAGLLRTLEDSHRRWKSTHVTLATRMLGDARGSGSHHPASATSVSGSTTASSGSCRSSRSPTYRAGRPDRRKNLGNPAVEEVAQQPSRDPSQPPPPAVEEVAQPAVKEVAAHPGGRGGRSATVSRPRSRTSRRTPGGRGGRAATVSRPRRTPASRARQPARRCTHRRRVAGGGLETVAERPPRPAVVAATCSTSGSQRRSRDGRQSDLLDHRWSPGRPPRPAVVAATSDQR